MENLNETATQKSIPINSTGTINVNCGDQVRWESLTSGKEFSFVNLKNAQAIFPNCNKSYNLDTHEGGKYYSTPLTVCNSAGGKQCNWHGDPGLDPTIKVKST